MGLADGQQRISETAGSGVSAVSPPKMGAAPEKSKLRTVAEVVWLYYSAVSGLFLIGLIVDLLYIWSTAYSNGVLIYVNEFGEGHFEMLIFASVLPWLAITLGRILTHIEPSRGRRWRAAESWKAEQARRMGALPVGAELVLEHSSSQSLEGKVVVVVSQRKKYLEVKPRDDPGGRTFFIPHADFWRVKAPETTGQVSVESAAK